MIHCRNCIIYYSLVALLTVSSWITTGIAQRELSVHDNEYCQPRPTLVAVDSPSLNLFPFYVTLQRCGGSMKPYQPPRIKACVANTTQEVKVKAINLDTRKLDNVVLKNHTSCKPQCKSKEMCDPELEHWDDNLCNCQCKYDDNPPEACPARFKWNKDLCQCKCDEKVPQVTKCSKENKEWSNDQCGCVCLQWVVNKCKINNKDLDEKNCQCVDKVVTGGAQKGIEDKHCISMVLLFSIMIIEFIVVMLFFDILCLYRNGSGFLHFVRTSTCSLRNNEKQSPPRSTDSQRNNTTNNIFVKDHC